MELDDKRKEVIALIDKAVAAHDSADALRFSQAACNSANAMHTLLSAASISTGT